MALTKLQKEVCTLIAANRVSSGESYIAGGTALNYAINAQRLSHDIDIFHDSNEALRISYENDCELLEAENYRVEVIRDARSFIEVVVSNGDERVVLQWLRDSAFRFFPLVQDNQFGLVLHPFDLATNKVLAMVGRLEVRDWVDVINCSKKIQSLGLMAWAASGKDPGFSPVAILSEAQRSSRYSKVELDQLDFAEFEPDIVSLSCEWKKILANAYREIALLPHEQAGNCLLNRSGKLFLGGINELEEALNKQTLIWHKGTLKGVLPQVNAAPPHWNVAQQH